MRMKGSEWPSVVGIVDHTVYHVRMVRGGWQDNALIERLHTMWRGQQVEVPGHGVFTVDDTAEGLVALLMAHTQVVRMEGDPPVVFRTTGGR